LYPECRGQSLGVMMLIKIGAKVVSRSQAVTFPMAEVAVPRWLFASIPDRIGCLRLVPGTG
jgi:hypothetical protein